MTAIEILDGDWEVLLDDENNQNGGSAAVAGMRSVQRKSGASDTVITTRALYSAVAAAIDDFIALGFKNAMLPTTPNAFSMENQYFIPRSSTQYLKEGAITADYSLTILPDTNGNGVIRVAYTESTPFVANDIGQQVTQTTTGDTGTLLDFDEDADGTKVLWIRPDDSSDDTFDGTAGISCEGTGAASANVAGVAGETIFAAVQAIGSVPTATDVYIFQNRYKVTSSDGTFQWWATDPTLSLGIISILLMIKDSGTLIADGDVEVFARRYTSLYDNFRLNVATGGFSALPLASAPDINNTTGVYNSGTLTGVTGTPTVGNAVYVGASWAAATAKGMVTAVNGSTDFDFYLIGDLTTIGSTTAVTGYEFSTPGDDGFDATTGTVAANSGGPTDASAGEGGSVTITAGHAAADHDGNGSNEPYSITVDCQTNVPIAKVYERLKYECRRGATADIFTGCNVPGESYRGLDGFFEFDAESGSFTQTDDVDNDNGTLADWTARCVAYETTTWNYITVTDQQTSVKSVEDDDLIYDEAGDSVTVHEGGTYGIDLFTSPKSSPFGTFTGTQIFGARGVLFTNIDNDPTSYILTDDLGILNNPPTTVTITVSNTVVGDRVLVAVDTGTEGVIDKDRHGGLVTLGGAYNDEGDIIIKLTNVLDSEVPQAGYIRVVETTKQEEHHYKYASRVLSTSEYTLVNIPASTCDATDTTGPTFTLTDTASGDFVSDGVEPGMLIQNTTSGLFFEVVSVDSATVIQCVEIFGTVGTGFTSGNGYEINKLIQAYANTDDAYDLIIDQEATTTSVSNTLTKTPATPFDVVGNVRQAGNILPFTQNQEVNDGGASITTVRQPDTIYQ